MQIKIEVHPDAKLSEAHRMVLSQRVQRYFTNMAPFLLNSLQVQAKQDGITHPNPYQISIGKEGE